MIRRSCCSSGPDSTLRAICQTSSLIFFSVSFKGDTLSGQGIVHLVSPATSLARSTRATMSSRLASLSGPTAMSRAAEDSRSCRSSAARRMAGSGSPVQRRQDVGQPGGEASLESLQVLLQLGLRNRSHRWSSRRNLRPALRPCASGAPAIRFEKFSDC